MTPECPKGPERDDDRIDRVAQALHEQRALEFAWNVKPWKELRAEDQRRFRRQAMAAIEAVFAGVSSPEVEAPTQHKVHVWNYDAAYYARCQMESCAQSTSGTQAEVEYWKDQHEADTLQPALTNESVISSQSMVCTAEHPEFGRCFIDADEHTALGGQDYHESEEGSWPCKSPNHQANQHDEMPRTSDGVPDA